MKKIIHKWLSANYKIGDEQEKRLFSIRYFTNKLFDEILIVFDLKIKQLKWYVKSWFKHKKLLFKNVWLGYLTYKKYSNLVGIAPYILQESQRVQIISLSSQTKNQRQLNVNLKKQNLKSD